MAFPALGAPVVAAFLGSVLAGVVARVLIALGITFATYTGIQSGLDLVLSYIQNETGALPAATVQLMALAKIDVALSMIFSAYGLRLVFQGLASGGLTRIVFGPIGGS